MLAEVIAELRRSINRKQLVAEVKNEAIRQVVEQISFNVRQQYGDEAIKRAVDKVATRVNTQIHRRLQQGITIKFADSESL